MDEATGMGVTFQLKLRLHDVAQTFSPWTSSSGMFLEVEVRNGAEIATELEYGWIDSRCYTRCWKISTPHNFLSTSLLMHSRLLMNSRSDAL